MTEPIAAEFYDEAYFVEGTKSAYKPYGRGEWVDWLTDMVLEHIHPLSVLDVGCAYGYVVERLGQNGIPAYGFDISPYAVAHRVVPRVWEGDASDPASYPDKPFDLVMASEVPEHLTEEQAGMFLQLAHVGRQLLILGVIGQSTGHDTDDDHSHIGVRPAEWWVGRARELGWFFDKKTTAKFNEDERSSKMSWTGRFLAFHA